MPIRYEIDAELDVIRETWSGEVTAADLGAYWRSYLADPQVLRLRTTLVDLRDARVRFTGAELMGLIQGVVDPVLRGGAWLTALVVTDPVQFGISRQYQVFAEHYSADAIFSDPEEALRWLLRQPRPA